MHKHRTCPLAQTDDGCASRLLSLPTNNTDTRFWESQWPAMLTPGSRLPHPALDVLFLPCTLVSLLMLYHSKIVSALLWALCCHRYPVFVSECPASAVLFSENQCFRPTCLSHCDKSPPNVWQDPKVSPYIPQSHQERNMLPLGLVLASSDRWMESQQRFSDLVLIPALLSRKAPLWLSVLLGKAPTSCTSGVSTSALPRLF